MYIEAKRSRRSAKAGSHPSGGGNQHQSRGQNRRKAYIPPRRESVFCLLSPVFRLQPPLPILPKLSTMRPPFAQNKPNFLNPKTDANFYATEIYTNIPLYSTPKNKPKTKPIQTRRRARGGPIPKRQKSMHPPVHPNRHSDRSPLGAKRRNLFQHFRHLPLCLFRPICQPYGSLLCKTNPISRRTNVIQALLMERFTEMTRPIRSEKTNPIKPKQTRRFIPWLVPWVPAPYGGRARAASPPS